MTCSSKNVFLLFLLTIALSSIGQNKNRELAFIYVEHKAYQNAIPYLKKLIRKDSKDYTSITILASCYYYTRQVPKAQKVFDYLQQKDVFPDSLVNIYFDCLKQQSRYREAKNLLIKFSRNQHLIAYCDSAVKWQKNKKHVRIHNLKEINTEYSEKSPTFHPSGILFLSNKERTLIETKTGSDGLPFMDLYLAKYHPDSAHFAPPKVFTLCQPSPYNEKELFFTKDNQKVYYSSETIDHDNVIRSKLYESCMTNDRLSKTKTFIFNDSLCSFYHPCIDRTDHLFFFASDMKGGFGGTDLYVSIKIDSAWQDPVNLGPQINTCYNELHPFYDSEGRLIFTSDRPEGMGGYDLFVANERKGKWEKTQNLKAPLNSPQDDMGLIFNSNYTKGYFYSNRNGGSGREDIYQIEGSLLFLFDK